MEQEYIIAYANKSILKISGLQVKGLNTAALEQRLMDKLKSIVRVIGVTGDNIEMDVYDIDPEYVRKNAEGVIETVALSEGITLTDVTQLSCSDKIVEVDFDQIPDQPISGCAKERWMKRP